MHDARAAARPGSAGHAPWLLNQGVDWAGKERTGRREGKATARGRKGQGATKQERGRRMGGQGAREAIQQREKGREEGSPRSERKCGYEK